MSATDEHLGHVRATARGEARPVGPDEPEPWWPWCLWKPDAHGRRPG